MRCIIPTMRTMRIQVFIATVIVLAVYLFLFYLAIEVWYDSKHSPTAVSSASSVVLPYVIVHIDLKGAPPKLEYLESLLPMLKEHGANGLLMEYEDMFPYEGKLVNFSAVNCYEKAELTNFLKKAADLEFEVIPLIQTFGHLEYALKLKEFRHLREIPAYPDSICPSKIESRAMIKHMLEQVLTFHNAISPLKYVHVGCDEVYHMNKCEQCVSRGLSNMDVFMDYVKFLSEYLREKSPGTIALFWDDMMRSLKPKELNTISFLSNIEPVYWSYHTNLKTVSHQNLFNYHKKFKNIWIASAFKGADGIIASLPNIKNRLTNHFSWMNLILGYKFGGESEVFNFKGIILTGWSRFSHMDPLCELLPVGIPSLILNLLLIKKFKTGIIVTDEPDINDFFSKYMNDDCNKILKCNKDISKDNFNTCSCDFDGIQVYNVLLQYERITADITSRFASDYSVLSTLEYYASKKFVNPINVMEHINWCNDTLNELVNLEVTLIHIMVKYYERDVIEEYVNYKTYNVKKRLKTVIKELNSYLPTSVWERKPIAGNVSGTLIYSLVYVL